MIKKSNIIKENDYYSILQLYNLKVIKWLDSYSSLKRLVKRDISNGNKIFKVIRTGNGNGTRYLIKGYTIIKLIEELKKGKIF
jgi:hypothetical protein